MITKSSSLAKGEVVTADGASTAAGVEDSPEIAIDPNDKHLGTDHLLSDLDVVAHRPLGMMAFIASSSVAKGPYAVPSGKYLYQPIGIRFPF